MMKVKGTLLRALNYLKAFEAALDYDPIDEIGLRIRELEMEAQLRRNELAVLAAEVRTLTSEYRPNRPRVGTQET